MTPFLWKQETSSIQLSGTLSARTGIIGEPLTLSLEVKHPTGSQLSLDSNVTPLFFSAVRFESLETTPQNETGVSVLRYAIYPLRADAQTIIQADLFCMLPKQAEAPLRIALQLPPLQITDTFSNELAPPRPLEPLSVTLQGESLMLDDLHAPMQIPSWQHNADVIRHHGVPWGSLALLATGIVLAYGLFSWLRRFFKSTRKIKVSPRDAAEEAMLQLKALDECRLVETHEFKSYYSSLVATLREYLNQRFPPTQEGVAVLPPEVSQLQDDLIAYADPVKFGKCSSTTTDCQLALAYVKHCVYLVEKERALSQEKSQTKSPTKQGAISWLRQWFKIDSKKK